MRLSGRRSERSLSCRADTEQAHVLHGGFRQIKML